MNTTRPATQPSRARDRKGLERILLVSDGGPGSAAALRWVTDRVSRRGAEVEVIGPRQVLSSSHDAIVVVGVHGRDRGPARFAELAMAKAQGPVVVVPSDWIGRDGPVVVGIGVEDELSATLAFAEAEAAARQAEIHLVHAWDTTGSGEIPPAWDFGTESIPERQGRALARLARAQQNSHPDLTVTSEAVQGQAVARLAEAARAASLLVVGRSHRNAVMRAVFGTTAAGMLVQLPCPLAVIP